MNSHSGDPASLQVRDETRPQAAAEHVPLRGLAPQCSHGVALGSALPHSATGAERPRQSLQELLCATSRLPNIQEEGPRRQLPLPRSEADQAGSGEQQNLPAEARLGALPQQPGGAWRSEERHRQFERWQMVHLNPDRASSREASCSRPGRRHRRWQCPFRHPLRWNGLRAAQQFQSAPGPTAQSAAGHEPKEEVLKQLEKAKAKVQRIHVRIANARRDYLHKASTIISKNHAMVFVEDLKVSNMSRSAAGTVEQPGRNVKQKAGLNRSILDQGWAEFRR